MVSVSVQFEYLYAISCNPFLSVSISHAHNKICYCPRAAKKVKYSMKCGHKSEDLLCSGVFTRSDICSETYEMANSSQWHQLQGFGAV